MPTLRQNNKPVLAATIYCQERSEYFPLSALVRCSRQPSGQGAKMPHATQCRHPLVSPFAGKLSPDKSELAEPEWTSLLSKPAARQIQHQPDDPGAACKFRDINLLLTILDQASSPRPRVGLRWRSLD